jgi:hypothetical protein
LRFSLSILPFVEVITFSLAVVVFAMGVSWKLFRTIRSRVSLRDE